MARFTRIKVLSAMYEVGLVPVFYEPNVEIAKKIVAAVADGGARCIEMTNRGDFAHLVFTDLVKNFAKEKPEVILGVGSICDAPTAVLYMQCGANFVVGPTMSEDAALACNRRKVSYSPGCGSATEIQRAHELGCEIVKVFPGGEVGGPSFVKAVMGPCPWTCVMPTGGVESTQESVKAWIKGGAKVLGMGSNLITKDDVSKGNFAAITERTRQIIAWIKEARG
jgi:2-dehydro-3-deoxyphosphogluconate aldolase / (4S)-4-hydroxy-2-oxoglutarate aldolase